MDALRRSPVQVIDSAPDKSCRKSRYEALRDGRKRTWIGRERTMIDRGDAVGKLRAVKFGQLSVEIANDGSTFSRRWNRSAKRTRRGQSSDRVAIILLLFKSDFIDYKYYDERVGSFKRAYAFRHGKPACRVLYGIINSLLLYTNKTL